MKKKLRGFEVVNDQMRRNNGEIKLPTRGTARAMAYDIYSPQHYVVEPGQIVKIWTDVKAYMQDNECLIINVRSSMGGKYMLANTSGWVDADFFENETNDGNIGVFLKNISNETQVIEKGDRIAQCAFMNFLVADDDNATAVRTGGFGSSGK